VHQQQFRNDDLAARAQDSYLAQQHLHLQPVVQEHFALMFAA
jgi:hypothetical protein